MIKPIEKYPRHNRRLIGGSRVGLLGFRALCCLWLLPLSTAWAQAQIILQQKPVEQAGDAESVDGEPGEDEEPLHDDSLSPFRFDAIDERTPFDPEIIRGLREIEEFVAREEWPEVVEALQSLIDRPETLLMPTPEGGWRTLQSVVADRISTLPPEGLRVYHQYFDAEAERLWERARQEADIVLCGELAERFPQTPAGQSAASYIGTRLFDEGDYGGAALWFQRVWRARPAITSDLAWRQRAAHAFIQIGKVALAKELFADNETAPALIAATPGLPALEWVENSPVAEPSTSRLTDWPQWHGTDTHQAAAPVGRPILLRQWHAPSTSRHLLQSEMDRLDNEFSRHQRVTLPAWPVTAVNGLAITRTFRGIQVVDVSSGELLWETDEATSPERVLTGDLAAGPSDPWVQAVGFAQAQVQSGQADSSMFTTFAYRDLTSGLLGSDGRQLFVLEDNSGQMQQPNPYSNFGMASDEDLYGRDWSTNRLVSYDLTTGKRRWTVGGTQNGEVFDPHLAGTFFLGVPVCAGDELYVVAERERMIHLFALNPDTGETLWSCELLSTGSSVAQDIVRRLWACQPSVCGSVIICPTGLGWAMGIDRWQHSIVWAQRYSPRVDGTTRNIYRQAVQSMQPLGGRWFMTPPIVSGHRVLMTPVEIPDEFGVGSEPSLICLDAYTGEEEWRQPQGDYVHLASVVDGLALMVGPHTVAALSVATGEQVWRIELEEGALPCGRGLVAGDNFLLPIAGGRLWSFALSDGSIVDRQTSVVEGDRIGNIAIHNGMLISSTPAGLSGYPLETTLQSWIDERLAADPNDPEAALRMAEMALVSGDYERALELLPSPEFWPDATDGPNSPQRRSRDLRRRLLVNLVENELTARDAEFEELQTLSRTDEERIEILKIEADRAMAREQWGEALDVYQSLLSLAGNRMVLDGPVEIRLDRLVSARMEDLWSAATPEVREAIDVHLGGIVEDVRHADDTERTRIMQLFGFHPSVYGLMAQRAQDAGDAGRLVEAEQLLNRLRLSSDPVIAADATWRYFELLSQFGLYDDIRQLALVFPDNLGDVSVAGELPLATRVEQMLAAIPVQRAPLSWTLDEPRDWSIERAGWQNYQQKQMLQLDGDLLPSLAAMELSFLQSGSRRIQFFSTLTSERWGTPVATSLSGRNYYSNWPGLRADGHAVYIAFQDIISCVSFYETTVHWATSTATNDPTQVQRYARGYTPSPLYPPESFTQSGSARNVQSTGGLLADANEFGVIAYGDEELVLLDPLTGVIQWRLPGIPSSTLAYLLGREVYLIDDAQGQSFVVRVQDGRRLESTSYIPSDESQRAAFERRTSRVSNASDENVRQRARRQAPPVRRVPALLPRAVDVDDRLQVDADLEDNLEDTSTTRVVCQWGDGLFAVIADHFVRIDHNDEQLWLSAVEPATGEQAWVLMFPAQVRLSLTRERMLFVLSKVDGHAWLVDLGTGASRELAPVGEELRGDHTAYVVTDAGSTYLIVNHLDDPQSSYNNLQSVQVHGTVVCWSRDTGEIRWQQTIENQQLVLNSFEESPVLVFTAMQQVQKQVINYMEARVMLVDKLTGHVGLQDRWASIGGSVNQFVVDPNRQFLELRTYNDRVRMSPIISGGSAEPSE